MSRLGRTFKAGRESIPPFYGATNLFSRQLGSGDVVSADQTSAAALANQLQYGRQSGYTFQGYGGIGYGFYNWPATVAFNVYTVSHPVWCVRPSVASQEITMEAVGIWSRYPYAWIGNSTAGGLQTYLTQVPIPNKALAPFCVTYGQDIWAAGSDQSCCIWNLDTDEMYEFWAMGNTLTPSALTDLGYSWSAGWAGYIPNASKFNGVFANNWGSRACSLGEVGGLITMQDLRDIFYGGRINHAIAMAAVNVDSSSYVAPASRGDGSGNTTPASIPAGYPSAGSANPAHGAGIDVVGEGMRFRFPANVDLSGCTYPLSLEIGRAIRDYGLIITDGAGVNSFYIEDPRTVGSPYHMQGASAVNPFGLNWASIQTGSDPRWGDGTNLPSSGNVLNQLPWGQLQVLNSISS